MTKKYSMPTKKEIRQEIALFKREYNYWIKQFKLNPKKYVNNGLYFIKGAVPGRHLKTLQEKIEL